jgi:hypothetical protein
LQCGQFCTAIAICTKNGGITNAAEHLQFNKGYVDKILSNVRTICNNTYVKPDGSYNVYVCVEMGEQGLSAIHKKLTDDQKLSIDYAEAQFIKDMSKAKEDFRDNR